MFVAGGGFVFVGGGGLVLVGGAEFVMVAVGAGTVGVDVITRVVVRVGVRALAVRVRVTVGPALVGDVAGVSVRVGVIPGASVPVGVEVLAVGEFVGLEVLPGTAVTLASRVEVALSNGLGVGVG